MTRDLKGIQQNCHVAMVIGRAHKIVIIIIIIYIGFEAYCLVRYQYILVCGNTMCIAR